MALVAIYEKLNLVCDGWIGNIFTCYFDFDIWYGCPKSQVLLLTSATSGSLFLADTSQVLQML